MTDHPLGMNATMVARHRELLRRKRMYCWKKSDVQGFESMARYDPRVRVVRYDPPRTVQESATPVIGMAEIGDEDAEEGQAH